MTAAVTPADRVQAFLDRYERTQPHRHVLWSDRSDHAYALRLDDLRALIALAVTDDH